MPAKRTATTVAEEVTLGRYDEGLAAIFVAVQRRAIDTATAVWQFDLDGVMFDETNLSPIDAAEMQGELRVPWTEFNFRDNPAHQVNVLRRMLRKKYGKSEAAADEWIDAHSFPEVIAAFGWRDIPPPVARP